MAHGMEVALGVEVRVTGLIGKGTPTELGTEVPSDLFANVA